MAGARSTNTFAEFMQRMLQDLAAAKLMPDADLQWLVDMETRIIDKARQPLQAMAQQGTTAVPPGAGGGMGGMMSGPAPAPPIMPPGMAPGPDPLAAAMAQMGGGAMPNGAVGGVQPPIGAPRRDQSLPGSDDELRRILS